MYHHILHNQGCEGRKEARRRVDQTTICMDCPDPYRYEGYEIIFAILVASVTLQVTCTM